jgi:hypothetical protein
MGKPVEDREIIMKTNGLGLAAGLSNRPAAMLSTFGRLVLPALIAKNVCSWPSLGWSGVFGKIGTPQNHLWITHTP